MSHFHERGSLENKVFQLRLFADLTKFAKRAEIISDEDTFRITDIEFYYIIVKFILEKMGISVDITEYVSIEIVGDTIEFRNNSFESFKLCKEFDIPNIIMTLIYEVFKSLSEINQLSIDDDLEDDYFTAIFQQVFNMDFSLDILQSFGKSDMYCSRFNPALGIPYRLINHEIETFQFPAYKFMHRILMQGLEQSTVSQVLDYGSGNGEVSRDLASKTGKQFFTFDTKNNSATFSKANQIGIVGAFQMMVVWPPPLNCENDECKGCADCEDINEEHGSVLQFWDDFKEIVTNNSVSTIHIVMSSKSSGCEKFRKLVDGKQSDINGKQYDCVEIQSYLYFPGCGPHVEIVTYYHLIPDISVKRIN